jgi:hypothetical protein
MVEERWKRVLGLVLYCKGEMASRCTLTNGLDVWHQP